METEHPARTPTKSSSSSWKNGPSFQPSSKTLARRLASSSSCAFLSSSVFRAGAPLCQGLARAAEAPSFGGLAEKTGGGVPWRRFTRWERCPPSALRQLCRMLGTRARNTRHRSSDIFGCGRGGTRTGGNRASRFRGYRTPSARREGNEKTQFDETAEERSCAPNSDKSAPFQTPEQFHFSFCSLLGSITRNELIFFRSFFAS